MLLQRLKEYADTRMELPPRLYSEMPVRYIIELDQYGQLLSTRPTDTSDPANAKTKRGQPRQVPQIQRSSGIQPLLLADKADYTLGFVSEIAKPDRVANCHAAYLALLERCVEHTHEPAVAAVLHFLRNRPQDQLDLGADFDASALITFRVDGDFVVHLPSVQDFWAAEHAPSEGTAAIMQCIVCGHERPVLERMQGMIKGIPGGQTSGNALISANSKAFESYGLTASLVAPTCSSCSERFTKALNALLANQHSRRILGGAVFVFWTRTPVAFNLLNILDDPNPETVQRLLESVHTGQQPSEFEATAFYATTLSASGARIVVRDWIDTTIGAVQHNLRQWFRWQRIVRIDGTAPRPFSLFQLAASTVLDSKDILPSTPTTLIQTALNGTKLPTSLLYQAVRRNRAEQRVTAARAALIKLCFASQQSLQQEEFMVHLDHTNTTPAYLCGRLLAILEDIQDTALPGIKAGIVDRFFGTASSAPASVFGRLLRGAQPHLGKLERDNYAAYHALQRRMEEVLTHIQSFPRTLTLEEQGLFSLGYYHQRAHQWAEKTAASQRKKAESADTRNPS